MLCCGLLLFNSVCVCVFGTSLVASRVVGVDAWLWLWEWFLLFWNPLCLWMLLQAITSSGTKKGELFVADVNTQLKNKNITTDVKVDTDSNVSSSPLLVWDVLRCFLFCWVFDLLVLHELWNLFLWLMMCFTLLLTLWGGFSADFNLLVSLYFMAWCKMVTQCGWLFMGTHYQFLIVSKSLLLNFLISLLEPF